MTRRKTPTRPQADKLTFRLWPPYVEKVLFKAQKARLSPNDFGRFATMAMADNEMLQLSEQLGRIENEMIRLRKDFNDAVYRD